MKVITSLSEALMICCASGLWRMLGTHSETNAKEAAHIIETQIYYVCIWRTSISENKQWDFTLTVSSFAFTLLSNAALIPRNIASHLWLKSEENWVFLWFKKNIYRENINHKKETTKSAYSR